MVIESDHNGKLECYSIQQKFRLATIWPFELGFHLSEWVRLTTSSKYFLNINDKLAATKRSQTVFNTFCNVLFYTPHSQSVETHSFSFGHIENRIYIFSCLCERTYFRSNSWIAFLMCFECFRWKTKEKTYEQKNSRILHEKLSECCCWMWVSVCVSQIAKCTALDIGIQSLSQLFTEFRFSAAADFSFHFFLSSHWWFLECIPSFFWLIVNCAQSPKLQLIVHSFTRILYTDEHLFITWVNWFIRWTSYKSLLFIIMMNR